MTRSQLFEQIKQKKTFLCVGLDTDIKKIPEHLQQLPAQDAIFEFNKAIIDATEPYCIAYKPNLAFYEAGFDVAVGSLQMRVLGKAQAMGELPGFFKVVCDKATGRLLGLHAAGAHASDLVAEGALALAKGATVKELAAVIHAHPTLAEGVWEAARLAESAMARQ